MKFHTHVVSECVISTYDIRKLINNISAFEWISFHHSGSIHFEWRRKKKREKRTYITDVADADAADDDDVLFINFYEFFFGKGKE